MEAVDAKHTKEGREAFQASKLIVASKSFPTECDEMLLNLFVVHLITILRLLFVLFTHIYNRHEIDTFYK